MTDAEIGALVQKLRLAIIALEEISQDTKNRPVGVGNLSHWRKQKLDEIELKIDLVLRKIRETTAK